MYVQLDSDYYDHPKTMQLTAILGPEADCYPPRLWTWAVKFSKHGILRHPDMLEIACRWKGEKGKLHQAMMAAGFIDADGVTLHGWMERTGKDILRYEQKKESMRDYFQKVGGKNKEAIRKKSGNYPEAIHISGEELNGTKLNGTELNGTDRSSPSGLLATAYIAKNKGIIGFEKCCSILDFYLAGGVDYKAAESAIWNSKKGVKIWELLEPLRPKNGSQMPSINEIIDDWAKQKGVAK